MWVFNNKLLYLNNNIPQSCSSVPSRQSTSPLHTISNLTHCPDVQLNVLIPSQMTVLFASRKMFSKEKFFYVHHFVDVNINIHIYIKEQIFPYCIKKI